MPGHGLDKHRTYDAIWYPAQLLTSLHNLGVLLDVKEYGVANVQ